MRLFASAIDFMKYRKLTALVSVVLIVGSVFFLVTRGLNFSLDFTGGTVVEVAYPQSVAVADVRNTLAESGFPDAVVQHYGSTHFVLIRLAPQDTQGVAVGQAILSALKAQNPDVELMRADEVGAQIGKEMAEQGALAILIALIGTAIYIAMRYEYRFAIGAAVALMHDPLVILGIFAMLQIEFDLPALAAILAIIGYSLNDTIVVFDRIKENFLKMHKNTTEEIVNVSLNQTLTRTLMTSFLTLLVVVALLLFGGKSLFGFSLALTIGIIVGTYSSIYIASSLSLALGLSRQDLIRIKEKNPEDDRP
ncbi:MAG: protein translocase subunit SecF [Gammaproteobacteria bacterium]|jgi:preprotein translocase subunit SecF